MRKYINLIKQYHCLYKKIKPTHEDDYNKCYYCGGFADTLDHQPAISVIQELITANKIFECLLIPCCTRCNLLLSDSLTYTLEKRKQLLKDILFKKYKKKLLQAQKWDDEEIEDLKNDGEKEIYKMISALKIFALEIEQQLNYNGFNYDQ